MRLRTALVTARSAPAHERAIRTLMGWQIEVDEAMFLGGLAKGEFLAEFEPDFFFDDQTGHIKCRGACACRPCGSRCLERLKFEGRHQDWKRRRASRSSTRTPPYSIRINCRSCSTLRALLTRCRDKPTR